MDHFFYLYFSDIYLQFREKDILIWAMKIGGRAGIKNGGRGMVVMVKTIIICVRPSVWAQ